MLRSADSPATTLPSIQSHFKTGYTPTRIWTSTTNAVALTQRSRQDCMSAPDITAQSVDLARYSVTPTDVQTVKKELNDPNCDDRMVRQYIQATGGDLKGVSLGIILC